MKHHAWFEHDDIECLFWIMLFIKGWVIQRLWRPSKTLVSSQTNPSPRWALLLTRLIPLHLHPLFIFILHCPLHQQLSWPSSLPSDEPIVKMWSKMSHQQLALSLALICPILSLLSWTKGIVRNQEQKSILIKLINCQMSTHLSGRLNYAKGERDMILMRHEVIDHPLSWL